MPFTTVEDGLSLGLDAPPAPDAPPGAWAPPTAEAPFAADAPPANGAPLAGTPADADARPPAAVDKSNPRAALFASDVNKSAAITARGSPQARSDSPAVASCPNRST